MIVANKYRVIFSIRNSIHHRIAIIQPSDSLLEFLLLCLWDTIRLVVIVELFENAKTLFVVLVDFGEKRVVVGGVLTEGIVPYDYHVHFLHIKLLEH
mmetsp:Transcript_13750/g.9915  ORF Transcript_13750/g.9915 Transcript_13750/m.9915 type:complete len:97 (-) Transcript_13750:221-511(-)